MFAGTFFFLLPAVVAWPWSLLKLYLSISQLHLTKFTKFCYIFPLPFGNILKLFHVMQRIFLNTWKKMVMRNDQCFWFYQNRMKIRFEQWWIKEWVEVEDVFWMQALWGYVQYIEDASECWKNSLFFPEYKCFHTK